MNEEVLKKLLEKYYDGSSTALEESELKEYFSGNDVLPGYEAEQEIFRYYDDSVKVPEPSADFESRIIKAIDAESGKEKKNGIARSLIPFLSAAAGLLILVASYFMLMQHEKSDDTFRDPQIAYAETMKILMDVSVRMNHGARTLRPMSKINSVKAKSFGSLNKSTALIEKNLRSLGYLRNSTELRDTSIE
jgi:hypothetical protein